MNTKSYFLPLLFALHLLLPSQVQAEIKTENVQQLGAATSVLGAGLIAWGFYPGPGAIVDHKELLSLFREIRSLEERISALNHSKDRAILARDINVLKQRQVELVLRLMLDENQAKALISHRSLTSEELRRIEQDVIKTQKNHRPHRAWKMGVGLIALAGGLVLYFNAPTVAEQIKPRSASGEINEEQHQLIVALITEYLYQNELVSE